VPTIGIFLLARRYLASNQLSGSLPKSLGSLTGLSSLCVAFLSVSASARVTTRALCRCVCFVFFCWHDANN
jgi:hypothetical protein